MQRLDVVYPAASGCGAPPRPQAIPYPMNIPIFRDRIVGKEHWGRVLNVDFLL